MTEARKWDQMGTPSRARPQDGRRREPAARGFPGPDQDMNKNPTLKTDRYHLALSWASYVCDSAELSVDMLNDRLFI